MEHWKQLDKAGQQKQQTYQHHKFQAKSTPSNTDQPAIPDPIQSIANVLNQHSKFVKNQKKSQQLGEQERDKNKLERQQARSSSTSDNHLQKQSNGLTLSSSSHEAGSSPVAHTFSQVDQGNSYLYAYNDFVTSNREQSANSLCNHNHNAPISNLPSTFNNQETLIDSDEDDALSYILHQHRAEPNQADPLNEIGCLNFANSNASQKQGQFSPRYEINGPNSFEAQRIDHHLSCSRRSHPRHICGIGGSQSDKLNHIAARLREESQRAFVLNQRPRSSYTEISESHRQHITNDLAAIQAQQFTHDLKVIHNQLASGYNQQITSEELEKRSPNESDLSDELRFTSTGAIENPIAIGSQALLLDSTAKCSTNQPQRIQSRSRRQVNRGYLSWLFCCICNLFGSNPRQSQTLAKQQSSFATHNQSSNVGGRGGRHKRGSKRETLQHANESSIVAMYSSQQVAGGLAGAYYTTQTSQTDPTTMHQYANHSHHHHHYPLSSDSSLGSSAFASSAMRMGNFFRGCCSKKCLFIFCLVLIMLIFIFVIGISVYLNFLINSNKTNLIPLSGRLKVDSQGDTFTDQLTNRTSKEFIAKQQQYETILRGAFDRTQNLLKSYPNHLVKSEVYSFKQGSLWVYFRLFINKRTMLLDNQLMKRKSPDENFDKQFLPRLTQQTLHSGFEQLMERRSSRSNAQSDRQARATPSLISQREHVKSFDDQIVRLMPLIESIDLQSIQVTPEFDMLQSTSANLANLQQQSMSENLRASQFLTTASSAVMVATGSGVNDAPQQSTDTPITITSSSVPKSSTEEINVTTKKFTLYDYKENTTRPTTSSRPVVTQPKNNSTFLVNQQRKPAAGGQVPGRSPGVSVTTQSNTIREIAASRPSIEPPQPNIQADSTKDQVQLISGQPVVGQNNFQRGRNNYLDEKSAANGANKSSITLFAPLPKLDQSAPSSNLSPLDSSPKSDRGVNETIVLQMVAPYQKIEFSSSTGQANRAKDTSIEELWNNALGNSKKNAPNRGQDNKQVDAAAEQSAGNHKRLITVTTIGAAGSNHELSASNSSNSLSWNKIGSISGSNDNSAQKNASGLAMPTAPSSSSTTPSSTSSPQKPKVSPPFKHAGSIISSSGRQQQQQELPASAIVLNRDFQQVSNNEGQSLASNSSQQQVPPARSSQSKPTGRQHNQQQQQQQQQQQRKPTNQRTNSADLPKQRPTKPVVKQTKVKKMTDPLQQVATKNESTTASSAMVNSKGIRIVDNFTASLDPASLGKLAQNISVAAGQQHQSHRNRTLEVFNFNVDHLAPTLPTTIELTRSTSLAPLRTTELSAHPREGNAFSNDQRAASSVDYTTTSSVSHKPVTTPLIATVVVTPTTRPLAPLPTISSILSSNQLIRPGTTQFSNQWRPLANQTSTRQPNLALLIGADRLPPTINVPSSQGSQSPFAMSTAILENQLKPVTNTQRNQNGLARRINKLSNTYHVVSSNEFESHRMSRMRQQASSPSAQSTVSSLNQDATTRFVDDFMITTDGSSHGSTMLPPLVLSNLQRIDQMPKVRSANAPDLQPKRTRGPFAFETLKAIAADPSSNLREISLAEIEDESALALSSQSRSERSPLKQGADQKLLVRKKLFLDSGDEEELRTSSSTSPSSVSSSDLSEGLIELGLNPTDEQTDRFGNRKQTSLFRCPHYGCKAKGSLKLTCLNITQICDDFIDCQDESDELDCVSLLKHDGKSNRLSFSNGGGIIYLNRKGSLAPMCIDYFADGDQKPAPHLNPTQSKKQQQLIKQINTIGQYACSLQSFSRLVSVKINHHSLVDGLNLIKSSRLYHRLSIVEQSDEHDLSLEGSFGTYRSGSTSEHEVEISTSPECPSQRTVFVKCGSFECGQDSFSVIDQNSNAAKRKEGVIINDFPWLVKLYWLGSLSCHGYLIDELWLISSRECFANRTRTDENGSGWSAEISYEHYGNYDYQSIESNRRNIKEILVQQQNDSSIVLAKFEKPVRFSPLNRPICLPLSAINKTDIELDRVYKDCVTATLPRTSSEPPTQDLLLSKVKVHSSLDCMNGEKLDDLICVTELSKSDGSPRIRDNEDSTRVLICSANQPSRSRSKWIVVGVQNKERALKLDASKQLFTSVSSQMDWIVDTMNPKFYPNLPHLTSSNEEACNQFRCSSGECLSWSRICDGLYDCSSHDDEKDCHK